MKLNSEQKQEVSIEIKDFKEYSEEIQKVGVSLARIKAFEEKMEVQKSILDGIVESYGVLPLVTGGVCSTASTVCDEPKKAYFSASVKAPNMTVLDTGAEEPKRILKGETWRSNKDVGLGENLYLKANEEYLSDEDGRLIFLCMCGLSQAHHLE